MRPLKTASSQPRTRKCLIDQVDGRAGPLGRAERPEVAGPVGLDPAAEIDARVLVPGRDLEVGEALVVLEPEVEAGLVLLDVVVLEEGGFPFGTGQDEIDVGRLAEDVADLEVGVGQEIGADAVAQGPGLADVDDLAGRVLEKIDAGLGRELGGALFQLVEVRHNLFIFRLFRPIFRAGPVLGLQAQLELALLELGQLVAVGGRPSRTRGPWPPPASASSSSSMRFLRFRRREVDVLVLGDLGVVEVVALVDAGQDLVDALDDRLRRDAVGGGCTPPGRARRRSVSSMAMRMESVIVSA